MEFETTYNILIVTGSFAVVIYLFQKQNPIDNIKSLLADFSKK